MRQYLAMMNELERIKIATRIRAFNIIQRQVIGSITLYFEQRDNVWVNTLVSVARPKIEKLAKELEIRDEVTFYSDHIAQYPEYLQGMKPHDYLNRVRGLMAHPLNPNNHRPEIFPDAFDPANLILCAIFDLMKFHDALDMETPPEMCAFGLWHIAVSPDHGNQGLDMTNQYRILRDIRSQSSSEQRRRGLKFMNWFVAQSAKQTAEA